MIDTRKAARPQILLQVRPRKIAILAGIAATLVVAVMTIVGLTLVRELGEMRQDGIYFRTADAVSMIVLGLLLAGGILLVARPRLRIDVEAIRVRNIFSEKAVPWALVERLAFPEGSQWAQLQMADDEMMQVMAIQAMDKHRAVDALQRARELVAVYAPPQPERVVRPLPPAPNRPLGRLEKIDREKLSGGSSKRGNTGR